MDLSLNNYFSPAFLVAVIVLVSLWWYAYHSRLNFKDTENERSLHQGQMLTGAGIFMFLPFCLIGVFLYPLFVPLYFILIFAVVGLLDDRYDLSFKLRLLIQAFLSALVLIYINFDVSLLWFLFLVFALMWWINLFNFMDGANGLSGVHALVSMSFYAYLFITQFSHINVLHYLTVSAVLITLIYLVFNLWLKKVFMGDSGSLPLAMLIGVSALYSVHYELLSYSQVALIHAVFIMDATLTLFNRLIKGENVAQAHSSHLYQRLIKSGWQHSKVAYCYGLITVICCGLVYAIGLAIIPVIPVFIVVYGVLLMIFMKTLSLGR